jgi:hypothetical protein
MNALAAIDVVLALISRATAISAMIGKAQAEGRTELSTEEWDQVISENDAAREALAAAIAKAKAEGR